ncbi:MAG: hypothetical protein FJ280_18380 [Planctomycetes bacterium]|nr:hypothetical protein [Planctomycetota bacterium]
MRNHIGIVLVLTLLTILGTPAPASGEPQLGTVQLPKDMTIEIRCSIAGTGDPAVLPQGGYTLTRWSLRRTDEQGVSWTCDGYVPDDKSLLRVQKDRQSELPVGEPFVSVLTATRRGSEYWFSHRLEGRLGEKVSVYRDGERVPEPKLRIRNADGSYDQSLTFRTYSSSGGGGLLGGG